MRIVEADTFERIESCSPARPPTAARRGSPRAPRSTKDYLAAVERYDWFDIRLADEDVGRRSSRRSRTRSTQKRHEFDARVRGEAEEAHAGRRAAAGRAEDGQGLRGGEAPPAAGRQDGRPPRQQGRDLEDRAGRGHAVHGRRHAGRHRAQPAGRALAHERRPDPRDAPRAGRPRASASASASMLQAAGEASPSCASSSSEIYNRAAARRRTSTS